MMKDKKGTTFVELLLYISIFLIITPALLMVSINSARQERTHITEKQVNADSQFMVEKVYDYITQAKKVDYANTVFDNATGQLTLIMQDNSNVVIKLNPVSKRIEVTEGGITSNLSSSDSVVQSMYFERITAPNTDADIVLGVNVHINIKGQDQYDVPQNYVTSGNLERGDYDSDGCPDYMDKFPKHAECCGDADGDGICDELDNCPMQFNPFQEDYDADNIGDVCDSNVYLGPGGNGGSGGFGAFNCSSDQQLINIINNNPPIKSQTLKQILVSSSPLPPSVMHEVIVNADIFRNVDFRAVFIQNVLLPTATYNELMSSSNVDNGSKVIIAMAQLLGKFVPWFGNRENETNYQVAQSGEACNGSPSVDTVTFSNASRPLPSSDAGQNTDVFIVSVSGGTSTVKITTKTAGGTAVDTITGAGHYATNSLGFMVSLESITGNNYAFTINSISNTEPLTSVAFNFGCGATVLSPSNTYTSSRYVCYCQGGCDTNCGDGGTGILTNSSVDQCYQFNKLFPEWCSRWETFEDNNSTNPAYLGSTRAGESNLYWEKTFKTMLTTTQLTNLKSITVAGQVAYQSTAQFFCDTLGSQCPMKATLMGNQIIELYNFQTNTWDNIGSMGLSGTTSSQQIYEVKYGGTNPLKYVGGSDGRTMKARMQFHYNGVVPVGQHSAPAFMCIDYFTLHLKW